ncbi:uncharacterized protein LOC143293174 [Babylonia areolata]|uniref:uncharacterized protein LOC143293174 n=1 Tax=Babylonia areolata TaxID=304850 RepID=UPI003FD672FE
MARCRFRPVAYRIGLCFIALGFVLIGLGYGFPSWVRTSKRKTLGLWFECGNQWSSCLFVQPKDVFDWAVRSVLGASLLLYLATFCMAIRENCCSVSFHTCCLGGRKTEVLAFLAELLGIAGVLLFSVKEYEAVGDFGRLSWAHALCDFGLAVSLIGSIMMACAQQSLPAAKAAAGRIVAKPGYESLANNNRSASMQSRSTHCTQASPFQGRTTPHISGPFPSPAAIAAVNAAVSPKQQRAAMNGPQGRKLSSPTPYPALDSHSHNHNHNFNHNHCTTTTTTAAAAATTAVAATSSPSRRRKSSAQERQFAGVHNQGKHPPVYSSEHVQEEWRTQQSNTWSESMRAEDPGVKQQRALKSQMEQEQALAHHAHTWSAANERGRAWGQSAHTEHHHYDRDWRATSNYTEYTNPPPHHNLPPPPAPPSTVAPASYGSPAREGYQDYPPPPPAEKPPRQMHVQGGYQYPGPGYTSEGQGGNYLPPPQHNPRPDSGNFPDPPPPEQLLCYEEERPTETVSYHGFPNPIPGDMLPPPPGQVQPVVLYRSPSHPGQAPATHTAVAYRAQDPYHAPNPRPPMTSHPPHQQHPQLQQPHQTFPRQQPAHHHHHHPQVDPHVYATYRR